MIYLRMSFARNAEMWIFLTLTCAFAQALWMALSKRRLQTLSSARFILFLRAPVALLMIPIFILHEPPAAGTKFWLVAVITSALECVRLVAFARATRRDYYSTYALLGTSPLFVLLLAPHMIGERLTIYVVFGAILVVMGGFVFYHAGKFQLVALGAAVTQGVVTTFCKLGVGLGGPIYFMAALYTISPLMLLVFDANRSSLGAVARSFRQEAKKTLPISAVNLISIVTFMFALHLAPVTRFAVLFRTCLVFGFILSLVLLKEYSGWRWKVAGAALILAGSILVM